MTSAAAAGLLFRREHVPPMLFALGVALVLIAPIFVIAGLSSLSDALGPDTFEWASGAARLIAAALALIFLWRRGWLRSAGLTGSWRPGGLKHSWLIILAIPMVAVTLFVTSWEAVDTILAIAFLAVTAAVSEALIFRGVIFVWLADRWRADPRGIQRAAVVAAVFFGLAHPHPILLFYAAAIGLAFARLQLDTMSIYPAIVLHFLFDFAVALPIDEFGETFDSASQAGGVIALPLTILAAVLAYFALGRRTDHIHREMKGAGRRIGPGERDWGKTIRQRGDHGYEREPETRRPSRPGVDRPDRRRRPGGVPSRDRPLR